MRTVSISVYNSKTLELFVEKLKDHFEFWAVGIVKDRRVVIDHHLTHNDIETRLEYARPEDLIWRDADRLEIPAEKHQNAIEREETMARGVFWDSVDSQINSYAFLDRDKKDTTAARKLLLGQWTDGVLSFGIEPNDKLSWSCADHTHWLNRVAHHIGKPPPNWWSLNSRWALHIMNTEHSCGTHAGVVHVDEKELHLNVRGKMNRMVYVFQKVPAV